MATQKLNTDPVFGPVRLSRLDKQARKELKELLGRALGFAAQVVGADDHFRVGQIALAIADEMIAETAPSGVSMEQLCERARTSDGRIREYFDEDLRDLVDIAVRALLLMTNRTPINEYVRTEAVRVGRDANAIGIEHEPYAPHVMSMMVATLGCCDRNLIHHAEWLLSGTHHDHSMPHADLPRIAEFEDELKRNLPGTLEEHLETVFAASTTAQDLATYAASMRRGAFLEFGVEVTRFLRFCFPKCVIIDRLPCGPPRAKPMRDFSTESFPGDDASIVAAVERAGRYGIARCRLQEAEVRVRYSKLEDQLLPALSERLGERPVRVSPSRLGEVEEMERARLAGVGANIRQVGIWCFPKAERIFRAMQASDAGGEFIDADLWRTIRLSDERAQRAAVALLERAQQVWPRSCIDRYRREFEPGLMMASSARTRTGLLYSSLLASAAGVSAHREMEIRNL